MLRKQFWTEYGCSIPLAMVRQETICRHCCAEQTGVHRMVAEALPILYSAQIASDLSTRCLPSSTGPPRQYQVSPDSTRLLQAIHSNSTSVRITTNRGLFATILIVAEGSLRFRRGLESCQESSTLPIGSCTQRSAKAALELCSFTAAAIG